MQFGYKKGVKGKSPKDFNISNPKCNSGDKKKVIECKSPKDFNISNP